MPDRKMPVAFLAEAQVFVGVSQVEAESFHGEFVVVAGGEAGDGDRSHDAAGGGDRDGEAATHRRVEAFRKRVALGNGLVERLEAEADRVGAAVEAGDDVCLASGPACVVGGRAGESGVEEGLGGRAEAADVEHEGVLAGDGKLADHAAQAPGDACVEVR